MRAALWLSGVLLLLIPRPALAQPMPTGCSMECPSDSAHPGLELHFPADAEACHVDESVVQCRCYDRCGDDSGGGGAGGGSVDGTQQQQQGVPPIVTALVKLAMLAVAPAFTLELTRNPADIQAEVLRARAEWLDYRNAHQEVVELGERWSGQRRREKQRSVALQREMDASTKPPAQPPDYRPIPVEPPAERRDSGRWGADGYCTKLYRASDRLLVRASHDADQAATKAAVEAALPGMEKLSKAPAAAAGDQLLRSIGAAEFAERAGQMKQAYDGARKFSRAMTALLACLARVPRTGELLHRVEAVNRCLEPLHDAGVPEPLVSLLKKKLGPGTARAIDDVRRTAAFVVDYVRDIGVRGMEMAAATPGCLR